MHTYTHPIHTDRKIIAYSEDSAEIITPVHEQMYTSLLDAVTAFTTLCGMSAIAGSILYRRLLLETSPVSEEDKDKEYHDFYSS